MKEEDKIKLIEIRKHLGELHAKWELEAEDNHHKSNEGYVGLVYRFPNWFETSSKEEYINAIPKLSMIEVYSYLFGTKRLHTFDTIDQAYKEVMEW